MKLILNPKYGLYEKDKKVYCDSLQIAETFNKRHDNIIRDIENQFKNIDDLGLLNFEESNFIKATYVNLQNKKQPKYLLTKDGFSYIVMGFTGKEAALFKIEYITRFNQMEAFIQSLYTTRLEFPFFTDAIKESHKEPKSHHYQNEINLIYRIVLNHTAKSFKQLHDIKDNDSIRPYLTLSQIQAIEVLQRVDVGLLEIDASYEERKEILSAKFKKLQLKLVG